MTAPIRWMKVNKVTNKAKCVLSEYFTIKCVVLVLLSGKFIIYVCDFYLQGAENRFCRIRELPYPCKRVSEENSRRYLNSC